MEGKTVVGERERERERVGGGGIRSEGGNGSLYTVGSRSRGGGGGGGGWEKVAAGCRASGVCHTHATLALQLMLSGTA